MSNPFTSDNLITGFLITFAIAMGIFMCFFCYAFGGVLGVIVFLAFIACVIGITMYLDWRER